MGIKIVGAIYVVLFACLAAPNASAGEIKTQAVQFAKGSSFVTLKGGIKGDQIVDYTLRARAGQTMNVRLVTRHGANYFNVLPPGSTGEAIYIGSTSGNEWSGALQTDGEYRVRVYLMRSAARRNESVNYTLEIGIADASSDLGRAPASDAKVAGTPYHATGKLPCMVGDGPRTECGFGVKRGKSGNAEVHVVIPGGMKRVLVFIGSKVTATMGDMEAEAKVRAVKRGDLWLVDLNEHEHFEIPEAVIVGG